MTQRFFRFNSYFAIFENKWMKKNRFFCNVANSRKIYEGKKSFFSKQPLFLCLTHPAFLPKNTAKKYTFLWYERKTDVVVGVQKLCSCLSVTPSTKVGCKTFYRHQDSEAFVFNGPIQPSLIIYCHLCGFSSIFWNSVPLLPPFLAKASNCCCFEKPLLLLFCPTHWWKNMGKCGTTVKTT